MPAPNNLGRKLPRCHYLRTCKCAEIQQVVEGLKNGYKHQTLLGATGTGKTFAMANVVEEVQRPTLVIAHNKTLAAQLYSEFKEFFPHNAVAYFVSYYDYYQPEAYRPCRGNESGNTATLLVPYGY